MTSRAEIQNLYDFLDCAMKRWCPKCLKQTPVARWWFIPNVFELGGFIHLDCGLMVTVTAHD